MEQTKCRKKNKLLWIGVILLVVLLSVLGTLAYLRDNTDERQHTFVLGEGVDVELEQDTSSNQAFTPGMVYTNKAATVLVPETAMEKEYLAAKVHFYVEEVVGTGAQQKVQYKQISYDEFTNRYATLQSDDTQIIVPGTPNRIVGPRQNWTITQTDKNTGACFYLGTTADGVNGELTVAENGSGHVLFDYICVNDPFPERYGVSMGEHKLYDTDGVTPVETRDAIEDEDFVGFRIVVSAFAVQGDIGTSEGFGALTRMMEQDLG